MSSEGATTGKSALSALATLYLASTPMEALVIPGVRSLATLFGGLFLISWLFVTRLLQPRPWRVPLSFTAALTGLVIWTAIGSAWTWDLAATKTGIWTALALALSAVAIGDQLGDRPSRVAWAVTFGCVVASIPVLLSPPDPNRGDRTSYAGIDENLLALTLCFGVASMLFLLLAGKTRTIQKAILVGGVLLCAQAILLTGSRTGLGALLAVFVVAAGISLGNPRRAVLVVSVVGSAYWIFVRLASTGRLPNRILIFMETPTISDDRDTITQAFLATRDYWWLKGVGFNADLSYLFATMSMPRYVHGALWKVWIELGAIGLVIWACILIVVATRSFRSPGSWLMLLAATAAIPFLVTLGGQQSNLFWALMGFGAAGGARLAENRKSPSATLPSDSATFPSDRSASRLQSQRVGDPSDRPVPKPLGDLAR